MLGVVHLASRGRLVAPAGPPAALVPQQHRVADSGRDVLAIPDVQRQAGTGETGPQLPTARGLDRALMGSGWRWPRASHSRCWPASLSDCWPDGTGFLPSSAAAGWALSGGRATNC